MIKRLTYIFLVLIFTFVGCSRKQIIPNQVLEDIFYDAFMYNALLSDQPGIMKDSLDIYAPIFEKYGYSAEDVRYTIGNFSRKKSASLGKLIEHVEDRIDAKSEEYRKKVIILDTINAYSVRTLSRVIMEDSLINIKNKADSAKLIRIIPNVPKGDYTITYEYEYNGDVDKSQRRALMYLESPNGARHSSYNFRLRHSENITRKLMATHTDNTLYINFGELETYAKVRPKKKIDLIIRNFSIKYSPYEQNAVDSVFNNMTRVNIFTDEFFTQKDSLEVSAH